jgi:anti-sigma28 factor (negative regulator of flagellin synthesis)
MIANLKHQIVNGEYKIYDDLVAEKILERGVFISELFWQSL